MRPREPHAFARRVERQRIGGEVVAQRLPQPLGLGRVALPAGRPVEARADVAGEGEAGLGMAERQAPDDVGCRLRLGSIGFQELEPGGRGGEEVARLDPRAERLAAGLDCALDRPPRPGGGAPSARRRPWCGFPAATPRRSTAAPRRGSRRSRWRSSRRRGFSRSRGARRQSARSASSMPRPSSETRMRRRPPASIATSMWRAPASSAFSTSSLIAAAGRSITSPAAMRSTSSGSSRRIGMGAMGPRADYRIGGMESGDASTLGSQKGLSVFAAFARASGRPGAICGPNLTRFGLLFTITCRLTN